MVEYNPISYIQKAQERISGRLIYRDLTEDVEFLNAYIFGLYYALSKKLNDKSLDPNLLHKSMEEVINDKPFVEGLCSLIAANEVKADHIKEVDPSAIYSKIMKDNPLLNCMILCTLLKYNQISKEESAKVNLGNFSVYDAINDLIGKDINYEKKEAIADLLQKWLGPDNYRQEKVKCPILIKEIPSKKKDSGWRL